MSTKFDAEFVAKLHKFIEGKSIEKQIQYLSECFPNRIVFSTSLGQEDQVITDIILKHNLPVRVFTLDTGRLFEETYKTISKTNQKYGKKIEIFFPDNQEVEELVTAKGPFSFYESVENRKECCRIRKVKPLARALRDADCWITGLRADQSDARKEIPIIEYDETMKIIKFNPLLYWSIDEVLKYINENNVPYNALHDRGFISIGCEPCTRAIKPGENIRAGRWWWEDNTKKECGLHEK